LGLRDNVRCPSWAHWKARSKRPISVNRTFFARSYTAEALRTKIDRKSAMSLQRGHFDPKFQVEEDVPTNNFCMDSETNECPTTLQLTVSQKKNFVADFLQAKCDFKGKTAVLHI